MFGIDNYLHFSGALVYVALGVYVLVGLLAIAGQILQDRRAVVAARNGLITATLLLLGACAGLMAAFVNGEYHVEYVFNYSERGLPVGFKLCGLWAGLNGSLLFWSALLAILGSIVGLQYRKEAEHPVGRRLEPNVYVVFAVIQIFFLIVIGFAANPFAELQDVMGAAHFAQRFPNGVPDGAGMNPQLQTYWMQIHPPCLYIGWVIFTVPFAFAMASLLSGDQGTYWIRKVRRWTLVGWMFNTTGIILGGMWAYETLGWGGYWAWDPVENASFLPWFSATAFLHSVMVQERRGMLRIWNVVLICVTFLLTIFGTYLTRSGIVSSVHAFASGSVGDIFFGLLLSVLFACIVLIAYRYRDLRSASTIDNVSSREAVFVLNNGILLAIAAAIGVLTLWPKISHEWFGRAITVGPPVFNTVTTPLFAVLLLLTALGPGLSWLRTSARSARRNLLLPSLLAVPCAALVQYCVVLIRGEHAPAIPGFEHFYPVGVINYCAFFAILVVVQDFLRTSRNRARRRKEPWLASAVQVAVTANRRYGGYTVHVGLAVMAIGIMCSGVFKEENSLTLSRGETKRWQGYEMTLQDVTYDTTSYVYRQEKIALDVKIGYSPATATDGSVTGALPADWTDNRASRTLYPERRSYPRTPQRPEPIDLRNPVIWHQPTEDLYVFYTQVAPGNGDAGRFKFHVHRNPLIQVVWAGFLLMVLGGIWAALPMARQRRTGLSD
ncbi:MAG: cytochrome c-type biogenesis CcmF C-terminal domain-containing protein [Planctomycetota bacterium]